MPTGTFTLSDLQHAIQPPAPTGTRGQYTLADLDNVEHSKTDPSYISRAFDQAMETVKSLPAGLLHSLRPGIMDFGDAIEKMDPAKLKELAAHVQTRMHTEGPHTDVDPDPEILGRMAGLGTNAALIAGITYGLSKGIGAASELDIPSTVSKVGQKILEHTVSKGISTATGIPHPVVRTVINALRSGNAPEVAATAPAASVVPPPTPALAAEAPQIIPAGGYSSRGESIPSDFGALPPIDRSQYFRPLPNERTGAPAATPVEVPATQVAEAPAPFAQSVAPEAAAADDGLEAILQKSIDMVRARKGATGKEPVVSAANAELNEHLKQEAAKTSTDMESMARVKKALKVGKWLQDAGVSHGELDLLTPENWKAVAEGANVPWSKTPEKTIQVVKDLMGMGQN